MMQRVVGANGILAMGLILFVATSSATDLSKNIIGGQRKF
jgi:hypothetical protein